MVRHPTLDIDGTINFQVIGDSVRKWVNFELIPNSIDSIAAWSKCLTRIITVTNQIGIVER